MKESIFRISSLAVLLLALPVLKERAVGQVAGSMAGTTLDARLRGNADGSVTVQFRGVIGVGYRIEYIDGLPSEASSWAVAAENVVALPDWTEWTDATAGAALQRFYRVVPRAVGAPALPPPPSPVLVTGTTEDNGLHFQADSNTVQTATAQASESWARVKEAGDAGRLVGALGAGKNDEALQVLREYGVAETTLTNMAARLGQAPQRATLKDSFIRGVVSLPLTDPAASVKAHFQTAAAQGRQRLYWAVKSLGPDWQYRYDQELAQLDTPPIAVLDVRLQEVDYIRFFKWYDRYAERVHSVLLNSENLSNFDLKDRYTDANLIMSGLHKLIKARNPEAFVWARVVWQEDNSDVRFLKALDFAPDGLVIWNLHSFLAPFDRARAKYAPLVGESTPAMVAEFFGFWPRVTEAGDLPAIGKIIDANLDRFEQRLEREWGYCGLIADWGLVQAVGQARQP
jgi:hypothetical protein